MSLLADTQSAIAAAMLSGDDASLPPSLIGGRCGAARFRIHARHYRRSLVGTLVRKFPGTAWHVGEDLVASVAEDYIRARPPSAPCIAAYGADFPRFLARVETAVRYPYIESLARLDWLLGKASIAVDAEALPWSEVASTGATDLLEARVRFQPGVALLRAAHPVDRVILAYLDGRERRHEPLTAAETYIEVKGSRGEFALTALDAGQFEFRHELWIGSCIGEAASRAMEVDAAFDAGRALRNVADDRLIVSVEASR